MSCAKHPTTYEGGIDEIPKALRRHCMQALRDNDNPYHDAGVELLYR